MDLEERRINLVYESSVEKLTEVNSSFDRGVLRVAYAGKNRNHSYISRETFEKCIPTIYNCPIVCNYNRETNSIGAHDIDVIKSDDGLKLVNVTQPVGVVPESAKWWWEIITEENGDVHEYLCVDILIWKRQEAYTKIKENIVTDESMEITVKSGKTIDGYYHIDSFEFTAFCLLESAEPCYESSCVRMFSVEKFHEEYTKMMQDFKDSFSKVKSPAGVDIDAAKNDIPQNTDNNLLKGGDVSLDRMGLMAEYGLTAADIDFNIEEYTLDELKEKFEEIRANSESLAAENENADSPENETAADDSPTPEQTGAEEAVDNSFSLTGEQFLEELLRELESVTYEDAKYGTLLRYWFVDYDSGKSEVYCYDCADWLLYGFSYSMSGDRVVIDFDNKHRKKVSYEDFVEGDSAFSIKAIIDGREKAASNLVSELNTEIQTLKAYQKAKMDDERRHDESELFARFEDLNGIEAFEELRSDCANMSLRDIENKCFEIRGRTSSTTNFSVNKTKATRIAVETNASTNEPYGGLFKMFPPKNN